MEDIKPISKSRYTNTEKARTFYSEKKEQAKEKYKEIYKTHKPKVKKVYLEHKKAATNLLKRKMGVKRLAPRRAILGTGGHFLGMRGPSGVSVQKKTRRRKRRKSRK